MFKSIELKHALSVHKACIKHAFKSLNNEPAQSVYTPADASTLKYANICMVLYLQPQGLKIKQILLLHTHRLVYLSIIFCSNTLTKGAPTHNQVNKGQYRG